MVGVWAETIGLSVGAFLVAGVLEELTHAAAARPFAVSQDIRLQGVTTEIPEQAPKWIDKWISIAPLLVGIVAIGCLYLGWGVPPLSDEVVILFAAWAWFTVPSFRDLQAAAGVEAESTPTARAKGRTAYRMLQIEILGLWLLMLAGDIGAILGPLVGSPKGLFAPSGERIARQLVWWLGVGTMVGSVVWIYLDFWLHDRNESEATQ